MRPIPFNSARPIMGGIAACFVRTNIRSTNEVNSQVIRPGRGANHPRHGQHLVRGTDVTKRICSIEGCGKFVNGRGLCSSHYHRWQRHGDPLGGTHPTPPETRCAVDGCVEAPDGGRGWCPAHYQRWYRTGDPCKILTNYGVPEEDRFWEKVDKNGPLPGDNTLAAGKGPCWLWTAHTSEGYGFFRSEHTPKAHRFSYELLIGEIPGGLVLDHLCRVRRCVNPDHLEPVTPGENIRRGYEARRLNATCEVGEESLAVIGAR